MTGKEWKQSRQAKLASYAHLPEIIEIYSLYLDGHWEDYFMIDSDDDDEMGWIDFFKEYDTIYDFDAWFERFGRWFVEGYENYAQDLNRDDVPFVLNCYSENTMTFMEWYVKYWDEEYEAFNRDKQWLYDVT